MTTLIAIIGIGIFCLLAEIMNLKKIIIPVSIIALMGLFGVNLIDELPETQKQVLIMRHYMDLSFQEIAEQTGVSINTALGRMRYALMNMRKVIDKHQIILTN